MRESHHVHAVIVRRFLRFPVAGGRRCPKQHNNNNVWVLVRRLTRVSAGAVPRANHSQTVLGRSTRPRVTRLRSQHAL